MKKTFLKATLFSLMVSMVPAVITSCKDYDDDIKSLNTKDDQLQTEISDKLAQQQEALTQQINALEQALAEQKEIAATANEAAKAAAAAAQAAADKAQQTADAGVAAAAAADAKAQAANAEAEAAKAAAAEALAAHMEDAKKQAEALRQEIADQIAELRKEFGDKYDVLAAGLAKAATQESLDKAVETINNTIKALEEKFNASQAEIKDLLAQYLEKINKNTSDIVAINARIEGINTQLSTLSTSLGTLQGQVAKNMADIATNAAGIANNKSEIGKNAEAIAKNAAAIAANTEAINAAVEQHGKDVQEINGKINTITSDIEVINGQIVGLGKEISRVEGALEVHKAEFTAYQTQIDGQIAALEAFEAKYKTLLEGLEDRLQKIDEKFTKIGEQIVDLDSRMSTAELRLDGIDTKINGLETSVGVLQSTVAGILETISGMQNDITELQLGLASAKAEIAEAMSLIAKNTAAIEANAEAIKDNAGAIEDNKKEIEILYQQDEETKAMLSSVYNTLNEALTGLDGKIDQAKEDLTTLVNNTKDELNGNINSAKEALEAQLNSTKTELETKIKEEVTTLNTAIKELESKMLEATKTLGTKISSLETRVAANEGKLEEHGDRLVIAEGNITALQGDVKTLQNNLGVLEGTVGTMQETLETHGNRLTTAEADIVKINGDIANLTSALEKAQKDIVEYVDGALATLYGKNAKRLTSVTLVPKAYVGGIPTIDFFSAAYVPMVEEDGEYVPGNGEQKTVTNDSTQAFYRLNPAGVSLDDIIAGKVDFVQNTATSRAGETTAENVVKVVDVKKSPEGLLVVNATKSASFTKDLNDAGNGKIYTVALRVPIAEKNYYSWTDKNGNEVTEDPEDAVVYSEYTRVAETTFTPGIAASYEAKFENEKLVTLSYPTTEDPWDHANHNPNYWFTASKSDAIAEDAPVYLSVPYNVVDADLTQYVSACKIEGSSNTYLNKPEGYGFSFEYSFVETEATKGYAKVTKEGKLTAWNPEDVNSASRIGKVVTVRVLMKRDNDVVAQKYFNVQYVLSTENIHIYFDAKNDFQNPHYTWTLYTPVDKQENCLWEDKVEGENVVEEGFITKFQNTLWEQLGNKDFKISRAEFIERYTFITNDWSKKYVNLAPTRLTDENGVPVTGIVNLTSEKDWILAEVATETDFYDVDQTYGKGIELEVNLTPTVPGFPKVTIHLYGKVTWPAQLPTLGDYDEHVWFKTEPWNDLDEFKQWMKLAPTAYEVASQKNINELFYNGNVLTGREKPYIKYLNEAAKPVWDIQVNPITQPGGCYNWLVDVDGKKESAATIWYQQKDNNKRWNLNFNDAQNMAKYNDTVNVVINKGMAGNILVNSGEDIVLDWVVYLNGKTANNYYTVGQTLIDVVKPIKEVSYTPASLMQEFVEQQFDLTNNVVVLDSYAKADVAMNGKYGPFNSEFTDKWNYYGFTNLQYSINEESRKAAPSLFDQFNISVNEDGLLTFNTEKVALVKDLVIGVDVTGDYFFGSFKTTAYVTIKVNPVSNHARKR